MARDQKAYILVLPSLFTTGNLFCGFYSIIAAFNHEFERAAYAILIAGIFDVLDGRVARITKSQSQFGIEYDSIADVVSFGVAPGVMAYVWGLSGFGRVGWVSAFFFLACGALRLARFNTISESIPKSYFLGLPTPAAANLLAGYVLVQSELVLPVPDKIMLCLMFFLGGLMVSNIRYRTFKDFDLRHRRSFIQLVFAVAAMVFVAIRPEVGLFVVFGYYALWGFIRESIVWLKGRLVDKKRKVRWDLKSKENHEL